MLCQHHKMRRLRRRLPIKKRKQRYVASSDSAALWALNELQESSLIDTAKYRHEGSKRHELKNAPLLSYDASELLKNDETPEQYGIMGAIQSIR
jgi:hypothetical protein